MAATTKPPDVIGDLYMSLCADPELPAAIQWRVYRYAAREKKWTLMARLLALPHLDPALDDELGTRAEAKVRAAWIGRASRPVDEVLAALEKARKGVVYSAAAAIPGLPRDVYRRLVTDGRLDTARELLVNPDVPTDVKVEAAATYGERYSGEATWRSERALEALFSDQLGLLQPLVARTRNLSVIAFAADRVALLPEDVARLVDTVVMPVLAEPEPAAADDWKLVSSAANAVAKLLRQPNLDATRRQALYRSARAWSDVNARNYQANEIAAAWQAGPTVLPSASHPHLDLVRNAETPEQVKEALELVLRAKDGELAAALLTNPATGPDTVGQVFDGLPESIVKDLPVEHIAKMRARDLDTLAAIVVHNRGYDVLSDDLLKASARPAEALVKIVREYRKTGKPLSRRLGGSEYVTPSVMGALPLSFTAKKGSMLARRAVGDLLTTALGSDGDWEMFETLGNNFDGPLENLLLACGYVAATVPHEPDVTAAEPESGQDAGPDGEITDPDGIATWSLF